MSASGMADLRCRHCRRRFGFSYRAPIPASVNCTKCGKPNDTSELTTCLDEMRRFREQATIYQAVRLLHQAGKNIAQIAALIGIKESRVRPFLNGASSLTDDEFRVVSESLHLPVPFRSSTTKESHGQT